MVRNGSREIEPNVIREAAAEIYVLCFPLLLMDAVRRAHPMAPLHQFHLAPSDGTSLAPGLELDDPAVVVTSAWVDLADGPMVLALPHMHGRHFSLTAIDSAGEPFACFGSRTGDDAGLDLALVGPAYTGALRRGLRAKRATSDGCWLVSRIHARSMLDRGEAMAIARRQSLAPLEGQSAVFPRAQPGVLEPLATSTLRQASDIEPRLFFHRLEALLSRAPPGFRRRHDGVLKRLKEQLGGRPTAEWPPEMHEAVGRGFTDALAEIRAVVETLEGGHGPNWRVRLAPVHDRGESPLVWAARSYAGLGAAPAEELLTFICERDADGRSLWGANVYSLSFTGDSCPPVHAFWQLHTRPSAIDRRRGLGSCDDLLLNADGSLDLTIQGGIPERTVIANWLPAPDGEMSLVMHLYAPRPAVLSGAWRVPALRCVENDAGVRRSGRPRPPSGGRHAPP